MPADLRLFFGGANVPPAEEGQVSEKKKSSKKKEQTPVKKGKAKVIKKSRNIELSDEEEDDEALLATKRVKKGNLVVDDDDEEPINHDDGVVFKHRPRSRPNRDRDEDEEDIAEKCVPIERYLVSPGDKTTIEGNCMSSLPKKETKQVSVSDFFSKSSVKAKKPSSKPKGRRIFMDTDEIEKQIADLSEKEENNCAQFLDLSEEFDDEFVPSSAAPVEKSVAPPIVTEPLPEPTPTKPQEPLPMSSAPKKWYPGKQSDPPPNLGCTPLPVGSPMCLDGVRFVVTGTLDSVERDTAEDLIKRYGGRVTGAVSSKTDYLVAGTGPGQSKMGKANKLNIKIIDEEGLFKLIESRPAGKTDKVEEKPIAKPKKTENKMQVDLVSSAKKSEKPSKVSGSVEEDMLWVDKYKPESVEQIIGNKTLATRLMQYLQEWNPSQKTPKELGVLLSGPPGIGKSTAANVVARSCGFEVIEFNASDTRSAKSLQEHVATLVGNRGIKEFGTSSDCLSKTVLLMDEVDGMSSGDRGGMAELIKLLKTSKIPIICVCNDRGSAKVRSLAGHCLDLRFRRPTAQQIANSLAHILKAEHISIDRPTLEKLVTSTRGDIRQVIHTLQFWSTNDDFSFGYDEVSRTLDSCKKDMDLGAFDVIADFFKPLSPLQSAKDWANNSLQAYFTDQALVPLMVFDKYLSVSSPVDVNAFDCFALAADSISQADLLDSHMRGVQSFSLMPMHGMLSSVVPGNLVSGIGGRGQPMFPAWLGKNSTRRKNQRLLGDLKAHMSRSAQSSARVILMEYLDMLVRNLMMPLFTQGKEGIEEVLQFMDEYNLTPEDRLAILDFYASFGNPVPNLPTQIKTAFTRAYNQSKHAVVSTKRRKASSEDGVGLPMDEDDDHIGQRTQGNEEEEEEEDSDEIKGDSLIVQKKRKANSKAKAKPKKAKKLK